MSDNCKKIALICFAICVFAVIISLTTMSDNSNAAIDDTFSHNSINYKVTSEIPRQVEATGPTSTTITSITIPETVEYLGNTYAVTSISANSFKNCTSATSVTLSKNLTNIGNNAFSGCTAVTTVYYDVKNHPDFTSSVNLTGLGKTGDTTLTFGTHVTTIPAFIFYKSNAITGINISSSVTTVGHAAFRECYNITSINLSSASSLTTIGDYAFYSCTKITTLDLSPSGLTNIEGYAFSNCTGLTSVTFPTNINSIGERSFEKCSNLTNADLSTTNITSIGSCAFTTCSKLQQITIPQSVTSLGTFAFSSCTKLTQVTILSPNLANTDCTNIFQYAGNGGDGATFIFGPNVTIIPMGICYSNSSGSMNKVTNVTFNGQITEIKDKAFYGCTKLESISIPDTVINIGEYAFYSCNTITTPHRRGVY